MTNVITDQHGNVIEPRTIAADLMTNAARDIDHIDVWAHIGQAYDIDVVETNLDASVTNEVVGLISKAGIDLIWPDGSKNTELDAARVEIERLAAENDRMRAVVEAAKTWRATDDEAPGFVDVENALVDAVDALPKVVNA